MKMKKTDIGVVVFMYAVCAFFYSMCVKLKADSQTYPRFTIVLLFGLTTLYLLQMIVAAKKHGVESGVDKVFQGFKPAQFFTCLGLTVAYLVIMYFFGFYIATILFMLAVLFYLKVPVLHTVIAVAAINLLVFLAFTTFLGVKLPVGTVIKALF